MGRIVCLLSLLLLLATNTDAAFEGSQPPLSRAQQTNPLQTGLRNMGHAITQHGNTTNVLVAAAAAAGVSVLKKAWVGLDLKRKVENLIQKKGKQAETDYHIPTEFNAVIQDGKGMLEKGEKLVLKTTKQMDKTWQDTKLFPHEWEELKNTLQVPKEWTEGFRRQTLGIQEHINTVKTDLSKEIRSGWEDGMKLLATIKRSTSFESKASSLVDTRTLTSWRNFGEHLEELARQQSTQITEGIDKIGDRLKELQDALTGAVAHRFESVKNRVGKVGTGISESRKSKLAVQEVTKQNNVLVDRLLSITEGDGWELVMTQGPVTVYRKKITSEYKGGEKFYCIKAVATINADPTDVYELLKDPDRVSEYNDECGATHELPPLSDDTRLTWAASKKYGPFKARDFITRVHHRKMTDGTYIVMSQSEDVEFTPKDQQYVRTEVLLAGNVIRADPGDPNKTVFTTIAHINPGGAADTPLGAKLVNHICTHGPINFILKLEGAASHRKHLRH